MNSKLKVGSLLGSIGSWLAWIGVFVGAISLLSALTRVLDVGLTGFVHDIVLTYRKLVGPLYDFTSRLLPEMPQNFVDFFVVYLVFFSMSLRAAVFPLQNSELFRIERSRLASRQTVLLDELDLENPPKGLVYVKQLEGGKYEAAIERYRPDYVVWAKWMLLSFLLWPVFSLLPARRIESPHLLNVTETTDSWGTELAREGGKAIYANHYIRLQKLHFLLLLQLAMLPIAVALFLLLATYNPMG